MIKFLYKHALDMIRFKTNLSYALHYIEAYIQHTKKSLATTISFSEAAILLVSTEHHHLWV